MEFESIAIIGSGIAWTITYIALVYRGFKDKSYGMPIVPLALNFAWELTFSLIYPPHSTGMAATVINTIWMICDIGIIITFFMYGYQYFKKAYAVSKAQWISFSIFAFIVAFGIMLTGGPFFGQFELYFKSEMFNGAKFIAYIQNLVISICFILMLWQRKSSIGQSFTIAWSKWIGTSMTVGIYYLFFEHNGQAYLMAVIIGATLILDLHYMYLIYNQLKSDGINPWKRL